MFPSDFVATLKRAIEALEQAGLTFHLTGGLVSSYYGEPRLTQDLDVIGMLLGPEPIDQELLARLAAAHGVADLLATLRGEANL